MPNVASDLAGRCVEKRDIQHVIQTYKKLRRQKRVATSKNQRLIA